MKQSHLPGRHQISAPSLGIVPQRDTIIPPPSGFNGLFSSGFESTTSLNAPTEFFTTGAWQDIVGADTATPWPINLGGSGTIRFQMNPNTAVDATTLPNYQFNDIRSVTGHGGSSTKVLYSEQILNQAGNQAARGSGVNQMAMLVLPSAEMTDLYLSYWFKYQSNLATVMPPGSPYNQSRVLFEMKTGSFGGSDNGDYRVTIQVVTYGLGGDYSWRIRGDNVAASSNPDTEYWNYWDVGVPIATLIDWFKVEICWHRATDATGRFWFAVNGTVVLDRSGSLFPPSGTLPINRMFLMNNYHTHTYPSWQMMDDLEIWSTFPPSTGSNPPYAPH